jgi:dihydroxyacid dehydratase/phosphogluconate dehydratase
MKHTGRAVVFESRADLEARIDDPNLDVDENCVLVMREGGPQGAPGMPEWGRLPVPKKILTKVYTTWCAYLTLV